jgi:hypothetical protein
VHNQPGATIEVKQQVFPAPPYAFKGSAGHRLAELSPARAADRIGAQDLHTEDGVSREVGKEPAANSLDFRQLWHRRQFPYLFCYRILRP